MFSSDPIFKASGVFRGLFCRASVRWWNVLPGVDGWKMSGRARLREVWTCTGHSFQAGVFIQAASCIMQAKFRTVAESVFVLLARHEHGICWRTTPLHSFMAASGSRIVNRLPWGVAGSHWTVPPRAWAMRATIASPSPVPETPACRAMAER